VDSPQLEDAMKHLSIAIHYFTTSTCSLENSQDLIRILSKSEIFLFIIGLPLHDIHELFDFAIEKCRTQQYNEAYSKLYVSKYFQSLATFSSKFEYLEIPEHIREDVMLLLDGSAAKLGCYEGISLISRGNMKSGIKCIEKYVGGLRNCADQLLTKCLCLQILALFYTDSKEYSKSSKLSREAIEVCKEIGNYNLFLIGDCDETLLMTEKELYKGEQLILFVYLLYKWSKQILSDETQLYFLNFVIQLEQQLENKAYYASQYLFQIFKYGDCLLAILGVHVGQEVLLDEKITFLEKSMMSDDYCSLTDTTFPTRSDMSVTWFSARLLNCYNFQIFNEKKQGVSVDKCRNALDFSLKQYGKLHWNTAVCYLTMGLAENDAENYMSALNAFEQAFEIMTATHDGSRSSNANLAEVYIGKGESYHSLNKFESAAASFDEALRIKRKLFGEDTEEIAQILVLLGQSQWRFNDLSSGLATVEQALHILKTLHVENPSSNRYICRVAQCYYIIGQVHNALGNITESIKCVNTALEVITDCDQECSVIQSLIFVQLIYLRVDEKLYMELLESSLPLIKEGHRAFLPILYLTLGSIQVETGKYKAGLASLQEALSIELDITLRSNLIIRKLTVFCYISMLKALNNIEKIKLARKIIDRATQIAESLPEGSLQHLWIFRCYTWKGYIQNKMRKYITAIESLKHALLQLPKISHESCDKLEECECHGAIATAHFYVGSYKDALMSCYEALSVIKGRFPEGSVREAEVYVDVATVAQKMKNKTLEVSNLRLAYKMYSNVLGENHSQTQVTYIAYIRALIGLR
jgi:tetratricopeptide (TPR) repeat protein